MPTLTKALEAPEAPETFQCVICKAQGVSGIMQWLDSEAHGNCFTFICADCYKKNPNLVLREQIFLQPCSNCGVPTFSVGDLGRAGLIGRRLPLGMTMGNQRLYVVVATKEMELCANCRYSTKFERW